MYCKVLKPKAKYENFINGEWKAPVGGQYFENISPTTGQLICKMPRSKAPDVELALDAAHAAAHILHGHSFKKT